MTAGIAKTLLNYSSSTGDPYFEFLLVLMISIRGLAALDDGIALKKWVKLKMSFG